jgi:NitT/TauT family transport system ATP-binding protein
MKLEIKDLRKTFTNDRREDLPVLDGVDLEAASGEFISIVGPSGCGKSTLLEIIVGLQHKTGGQIMIDGLPLEKSPSSRAIVFQQYALFPWLTIQKNIEYGLKIKGIARRERSAASRKYIEMLGLSGFEKYYPHELSGGMQQRVALARALAVSPDILLLDEPFAALDAQTREVCQRELLSLWEQTGVTVLFVTHDVTEAIFLADRVVVMSKPPGVFKDMVRIDLGRPRDFMIRLGEEFRELEYRVRTRLSDNGSAASPDGSPAPGDRRGQIPSGDGHANA